MKKILFISYDGLTDSLGQSQILPYMVGVANAGYKVTILSCEKPDRLSERSDLIKNIIQEAGINWKYTIFRNKPPILSKILDLIFLKIKASRIVRQQKIEILHCRSYIAAQIGVKLKQKYGCKFIFDMRGFWVDERKDSGAWNMENWFYRSLYKYYKNKERYLITNADYIVSLTNAAKEEIMRWEYRKNLNIQVIPCCVDLELFSLVTDEERQCVRHQLGFSDNEFVVGYLGSIGGLYMLEEMLEFFTKIKTKYMQAKFLFITHSSPDLILNKLDNYGLTPESVKVISSNRELVPFYLKSTNLCLSFIRSSYSKIASSPTKNAEIMATGIPLLVNAGIGDVADLCTSGVAYMLQDFNDIEYSKALKAIKKLLTLPAIEIRNSIMGYYSLQEGIKRYVSIYSQLH